MKVTAQPGDSREVEVAAPSATPASASPEALAGTLSEPRLTRPSESRGLAALPAVEAPMPDSAAPANTVMGPGVTGSTRRLLDGPILPTILRLAAPNIVVVLVQVGSSTVDTFFVSQLGADILAGVTLVFPAWMLMVTMSAGGIGGGIASAIARALGGGRRAFADDLAWHAVLLGVGLAALFSVIFLGGGPRLYASMGGADATLEAAIAYSTVIFSGALAVWLVNTFASVLRGSGEMVVPAIVVVGGELLHLGLAPCLIFGLGPFPALGVTGAGLSLVTSYVVRALALGGYVLRGPTSVRPTVTRPSAAPSWEILRVGLPGSINTVLTNLNVVAVTALVGSYGTFALAGYGLGARLEYLQIPLVFGFGTALVTLVGSNIGAGQVARARKIAWTGAGVAACVTGAVGLAAAIWPEAWLGLFTSQPDVLRVGEAYLRIVGPTYGFFGLGLALYFASQGAGRLLWPLLAGVARLAVAVGGGWIAINVTGGALESVFVAIALSFVVFGAAQAVAARAAIRPRSPRAR
jgi:putative MATE family efflux protein